MADDFQSLKVAANEQTSSSKFDNFVQAVEDAVNSIDNSNISAAAAILVSKLAAGSNGDTLQTVAGVPTWVASSAGLTYQTTLPVAPANGQETILVDSTSAPTYQWRLRYNSTLGKWVYQGGLPAFVEVAAFESPGSSGTYVALSTAGPSFAIPVAGDYIVEIGAYCATGSGSATGRMSYDIGGTGAVDADSCAWISISAGESVNASRAMLKTGLTAVTLTAKYKANGTAYAWGPRWMRVYPVKL